MVRLDFSDNILRGEGIPSSIFKLKRLSYLGMHGNRFVGTISPNIGSLSRLQYVLFAKHACAALLLFLSDISPVHSSLKLVPLQMAHFGWKYVQREVANGNGKFDSTGQGISLS
mmetsp:Transcript_31924/g.95601  ORF Transcript_31924/g.95601 Transcript_31924/m.95601 type:complete len:114 (-) Transcript_31924:513-854(-)